MPSGSAAKAGMVTKTKTIAISKRRKKPVIMIGPYCDFTFLSTKGTWQSIVSSDPIVADPPTALKTSPKKTGNH
jgi:hypothetical protein